MKKVRDAQAMLVVQEQDSDDAFDSEREEPEERAVLAQSTEP